jgi:hypothetical protein
VTAALGARIAGVAAAFGFDGNGLAAAAFGFR